MYAQNQAFCVQNQPFLYFGIRVLIIWMKIIVFLSHDQYTIYFKMEVDIL